MSGTSRRHARELVLKGLYALEVGETSPDEIVKSVINDESLSENGVRFAEALFAAVREDRTWAGQTIARLATNWDLGRIAAIDLIILRMALTQLRQMTDIPVKVVLNEAIELAKEYSTAESSAFINGILDSFVKSSSEIGQR
jgi:N utilization substance protein B